MKVLNRIKSIYLLAIVALLSFCMLLFPAMPKAASAEEGVAATMGNGNVEIKTAQVIVQEYKNAEGGTYEKWAIMFKAELAKEEYTKIVGEGETLADVQFGMLIGPASRFNSSATFDELTSETGAYKYKAISYVGSVGKAGIQPIEFEEGKTTYNYWGSIVYSDADLNKGENKDLRKTAASLELTAVPFYTDGATTVVLMDEAKNAIPRNYLVESHLLQKDGVEVEDSAEIKEATVNNYAGALTYETTKDYYVCRSTNRLMVGPKQGELAATNLLTDATNLVYGGKARTTTTAENLFSAEKLASFPKYGYTSFVDYTDNGIVVYRAQVAERVIMRYRNVEAKKLTVDKTTLTQVLPSDADMTEDYLAEAKITISTSGGVSARYYNSYFYVTYKSAASGGVWQFGFKDKHEGLYVLGKNIDITTDYEYRVAQFTSSGYGNNTSFFLRKDIEDFVVRSAYAIPTGNAGFKGTFDGRGFVIDANQKAKYGILPPAFGAEIKNVAMIDLSSGKDWGGICGTAKNTKFENIYATLTTVSSSVSDLTNPTFMLMEGCELNNFVVEANAVTETVMNTELTYGWKKNSNGTYSSTGNSGFGQGKPTSGVFNFKKFADVYADANGTFQYVANPTASAMNTFNSNGALQYLGKEFTSSDIVTSRTDYFSSDVNDPFVGTTGKNVYAVGSTPLYLNHEFDITTKSSQYGDYWNKMALLDANPRTTVFVNSTLQYKDVDENGEEVVLDTDYKKYYKLSALVDENKLFEINAEDGRYSLAEIILKGKQFAYGNDKIAAMLANPETSELEVRLVTMDGWYDVANAENVIEIEENSFNRAFWNVSGEGVVTWAKLA